MAKIQKENHKGKKKSKDKMFKNCIAVFLSKEIKHNCTAWTKPIEFILRVITAKSGTKLKHIIKLLFPQTCACVFVLSKVDNALTHKESRVPEEESPAEIKEPSKITGHNKLPGPEASAECGHYLFKERTCATQGGVKTKIR